MIWSSSELSEALMVEVPKGIKTNAIQFNSKDVKPGDLFIALKGENGDGHAYVQDAINRGAAAAIVNNNYSSNECDKEKFIFVSDAAQALTSLAKYKRDRSKAKFIAITGSVGKTSTKEIIKLMLQPFGKVFGSRGNFNNYLGVPINLASMPDDVEFAVLEIGMNHSGEIRPLVKLVKPDIAIITNVCEAHIEFFNSIDDIADAKCEIFEGLNKNGIAIINRDTECFERIVSNLNKLDVTKFFTFSSDNPSDSKLASYHLVGDKVNLKYKIKSQDINIVLPQLSRHQAKNFAAGFLTVDILGLDISKAKGQLELFEVMLGRGKVINVTKGNKKYQIISDYYSCIPDALKASLQYLKQIAHLRKVVIIGDMRELGDHAVRLHKSIAPYIIDAGVSKALLIGENVKYIQELLPSEILTAKFADVDELVQNLDKFLGNDELILIKGAHSLNLQKIIEYFDNK